MKRLVLRLAAVSIIAALAPQGARLLADDVPFIRGDYNQDGIISTADVVALRRFMFNSEPPQGCWNAGDVDDSGQLDLVDMVMLNQATMMLPDWPTYDWTRIAPFPEPGPDPTTPNKDPRVTCESYSIQPPETTDDIIRIGEVEGVPGTEVKIPVYISTSVPVDAVQLVISYDTSVLEIKEEYDDPETEEEIIPLTWDGTYFEQNFFGRTFTVTTYSDHTTTVHYSRKETLSCLFGIHPQHQVLTAAICGHYYYRGFEIQPGEDILLTWITATISPDAQPGTAIEIIPVGAPGVGPYSLRCELTHRGEARYASLLPAAVPGRVGVVGDITFFDRGDANGDKLLDISDAVTILSFLFLGDEAPACREAADADASGAVELTDAVVVLNHLFLGGYDRLVDDRVSCSR